MAKPGGKSPKKRVRRNTVRAKITQDTRDPKFDSTFIGERGKSTLEFKSSRFCPQGFRIYYSPHLQPGHIPILRKLGVKKVYSHVPLSEKTVEAATAAKIEIVEEFWGTQAEIRRHAGQSITSAALEALDGKVVFTHCNYGTGRSREFAELVGKQVQERLMYDKRFRDKRFNQP